MSLPTRGIFYKDEKIVGVGACNPGWSLSSDGLRRCVTQSMDDAWEFFLPVVESWERSNEFKLRDAKYFTTPDDLRYFDYVSIFDIKIQRSLALKVYAVYYREKGREIPEWDQFWEQLPKG